MNIEFKKEEYPMIGSGTVKYLKIYLNGKSLAIVMDVKEPIIDQILETYNKGLEYDALKIREEYAVATWEAVKNQLEELQKKYDELNIKNNNLRLNIRIFFSELEKNIQEIREMEGLEK